MSPEAEHLLIQLRDAATRNAYMACHGPDRAAAHELTKLGLAEWKGESFGSSFWAVTDKGLSYASPK